MNVLVHGDKWFKDGYQGNEMLFEACVSWGLRFGLYEEAYGLVAYSSVGWILQLIKPQYRLFWVLIYFDSTLLDRSHDWKNVKVVTEEGVKEVEN